MGRSMNRMVSRQLLLPICQQVRITSYKRIYNSFDIQMEVQLLPWMTSGSLCAHQMKVADTNSPFVDHPGWVIVGLVRIIMRLFFQTVIPYMTPPLQNLRLNRLSIGITIV